MQNFKNAVGHGLLASLVLALSMGISGAVRADDPAPSMVVSGGSQGTMLVGLNQDASFDAAVNNPPVSNQECTISGPKWSWSASVTSGPNNDTSGASASVDSPSNPDDEDDSATVTLSFSRPGTYHVEVSANAHYTSSCADGDRDVSGSASFDVTCYDVSVRITQSTANPNPAFVGQTVEINLEAQLDIPAGVSLSDGPHWSWDFGQVQYRQSDADDWTSPAPDNTVGIASPPGFYHATYNCTFSAPGQYKVPVTATATFRIGDGENIQRTAIAYPQ